jgi:cold shock protein
MNNNEGSTEGTVRMFNTARGYGFITSDTGSNLFFHVTDVVDAALVGITEGDRVRFNWAVGPRGPRAFNVRKVDAPSKAPDPADDYAWR